MHVLRTPDERFKNLAGYDFEPHYTDITADGTTLRVHYLDEGPRDGQVVLCMHGQPSWCYLYRKMVPLLTNAGYRVVAPDLIGFGRSDKPVHTEDYTYARHVDWMNQWLRAVNLSGVTLVCQDWGGLIGLRMAAEQIGRFSRLVVANTGLPNSNGVPRELIELVARTYPEIPIPGPAMVREKFEAADPLAFLYWIKYAAEYPGFSARGVFSLLGGITDEQVLAGYNAPFPDERYLAGARRFPSLVPLFPHHKEDREANDRAWQALSRFEGPVLTAFSDQDAVTRGGEKVFQEAIPGARGRTHPTIKGAGHFLQEDSPEDLSNAIISFMKETS